MSQKKTPENIAGNLKPVEMCREFQHAPATFNNMPGLIVLFIFILMQHAGFTQLNCSTSKTKEGATEKKCFHKNGKLSTIETWDKNHREGNMKAFDANGKTIFDYGLRSYAGHASVYVDYYNNGQVKKAEYSSAPDGGIQFWRIIHFFDENGNETGKMDLSEPNGHPSIQVIDSSIKQKNHREKVAPIKQVFVHTGLIFVNETNKKVQVLLKKEKQSSSLLKDTTLTLQPRQQVELNPVSAKSFLTPGELYEPDFPIKTRRKTFKSILALPAQTETWKTYTWHIIELDN